MEGRTIKDMKWGLPAPITMAIHFVGFLLLGDLAKIHLLCVPRVGKRGSS